MDLKKELSDIKEILKNNPRGMTVMEIARAMKMNRHSVAKYMDMLVISGHVELKTFGSSKVFFLARRVPMSAILNFSSDFIVILNRDLEIINVNDRFLDFEDIRREDLLNKNIVNSSFPMEFTPSIIPSIKEALNGVESAVEAFLLKGENEYYFSVRFVPTVFDDTDKGVTIIFEDITGRKQAELALRESEQRFRAIYEHAAVGIAYVSMDGYIHNPNPRFTEIVGYTRDELKDLTYKDLMHADDVKLNDDLLGRMLSGAIDVYTMEKRCIRKDGKHIWVHLTVSCVRDPDGLIKYLIPVIEDITARKQAEDILQRTREELETRVQARTADLKTANEALLAEISRTQAMEKEITKAYHMMHDIIEKAPYGVYVVDEGGRIDYVNPAMLKISGDGDREFKNMNAFELPTYQKLGLSGLLKDALDGKYFFLGPVEYTSHFGKKTSVRNFIGIPMEEGGKKKVLVFVEDFTKYKLLEEALLNKRT